MEDRLDDGASSTIARASLSLFDDTVPAAEPSQPERPRYIDGIIALWVKARDFIKAQEAASLAFLAEMQALDRSEHPLRDPLGLRHSAEERCLSMLSELVDRMITFASNEFGPEGRPLKIERMCFEERVENFPPNRDNWETFDLAELWKDIHATYGGRGGLDEGYRQIAEDLVDGFNLVREAPVLRSGRLIVNHHVWCDDFDKKHSGTTRLSYNSADRLRKLLPNLAAFCAWADAPAERDLDAIVQRFSYGLNSSFQSREKHQIAGGRIILTCYQSRFEFSIAPDLGEQLQVFVSTYGQRTLNRGR